MSTDKFKKFFSSVFNPRRRKEKAQKLRPDPRQHQGSSTSARNVTLAAISPSVSLDLHGQTTASIQMPVTPSDASFISSGGYSARAPPPVVGPNLVLHSMPSPTPVALPLMLHPNSVNRSSSIHRPSTPHAQSFTPDPALKSAIEKYAAGLSNHDKDAFRSPGNIMDKIREIDQADSRSNLSRSFGPRIEKVLRCISNFVDSVAICIQHSPEISSLAIGGLHCVLRLVLGYIEFFESLTTMIERVGGHLNYLSKYGSQVFQGSSDVQKALTNAYCDLLGFFVAIRSVFADKEGRNSYLKSFTLFLRVTWEPFESRFKPIEDRFLDHTLIVVRSAGVENLIKKLENLSQKNQKDKVEKRRKVLEWLTPIDYEEIHQRHFKKCFEGTGQWLLDHPLFQDWEGSPESSLLWCHGIPGAGKTVLASLVVERLSAKYGLSSDTGISFVYCNFKESREAATYLRVAIKQLSRRMTELPVELETLYDNASSPGYSELQGVFTEISKKFKRVFFILDALDECTDDQKKELFDVFRSIMVPSTSDSGKIKLFITSRKEPYIQRACDGLPIINIEAKKVDADIKSYVTAQLDKLVQEKTLRLKDITLKDEIITTLVSRAGGMFLWIEFQLKHICSQISDPGIKKALGNLPEDMTQTYKRIIDSINKKPGPERELARRTLMWVAYAERPLLLQELVEAVAMEKNTKDQKTLISAIPQTETIFDVCNNLVVLDETSKASQRTIRFVHFSVQEFLFKSLGDYSAVALLSIEPDFAHAEITHLCINFLLFCYDDYGEFGYGYTSLITYAESAWNTHIHDLSEISEDLMGAILGFFKFGVFLEYEPLRIIGYDSSIRVYSHAVNTKFSPNIIALIFNIPLVSKYLEEKHNEEDYPNDHYAIHYAARQGSCKAIERLLYDQQSRINKLDHEGCTALYYAASEEVCQLLLDRGANVHGTYGNALQAAAKNGNLEVVQLLLDRGADVNTQGRYYGNALQAAAAMRDAKIEVVQLLLDRGADVNAQGGYYENALQAAAMNSNLEVVQLLLDRGADLNTQGGYYGNLLQATAAGNGKLEVLQLLLDRGADVNAQGGYYGNVLQAAAGNGKAEVLKLLLDEADVNAQDEYYENALQAAAMNNLEVVQLLLDRRADVNAQGGYHGNALQAAVSNGNLEVVQLLLDRGADVNAQGGYDGNVLQAAAKNGNLEVVQLLLDRGADVNTQGQDYGNALQAAAKNGNLEVVQLLLDRGADVNTQGQDYGNSLQAAAKNGDLEVVQLLLDRGADVNAQGGYDGNALQAAAVGDANIEVLELLLDMGADVNAQGGYYGNALQAAAMNSNLEVVQLLLDRGADVNAQSEHYGNALQAAAKNGDLEVLQLLLDRGADANAQGSYYGNALWAATMGDANIEVLELLLDMGADLNAQGGIYGNALQASVVSGKVEVVQFLLDMGADVNAQGGYYGNALGAAQKLNRAEIVQLLENNGATSQGIL